MFIYSLRCSMVSSESSISRYLQKHSRYEEFHRNIIVIIVASACAGVFELARVQRLPHEVIARDVLLQKSVHVGADSWWLSARCCEEEKEEGRRRGGREDQALAADIWHGQWKYKSESAWSCVCMRYSVLPRCLLGCSACFACWLISLLFCFLACVSFFLLHGGYAWLCSCACFLIALRVCCHPCYSLLIVLLAASITCVLPCSRITLLVGL